MQGKHVLLTGGTGGLGRAVTRRLAEAGATLTLSYVVDKEVDRLRAELGDGFDALHLVRADVGDESSVRALVDGMERIDALVHLVGGFTMGATDELSLDDWQKHHDLTLTTTFLCCKHALRRMRAQGYGRIVTIGSRAAARPAGQMAAYASAKAGVVALTQVIAEETRGLDITANCVLPSVIDTPQNRAAMGEAEAATWVKPESLAEVIAFLASGAARDLRGCALPVYGNA